MILGGGGGGGVVNLCFQRFLKAVFFPLYKQFLETEMTWSQPIIVRECIFKSQNLRFASLERVKAE